jgi:hypothetical protein
MRGPISSAQGSNRPGQRTADRRQKDEIPEIKREPLPANGLLLPRRPRTNFRRMAKSRRTSSPERTIEEFVDLSQFFQIEVRKLSAGERFSQPVLTIIRVTTASER